MTSLTKNIITETLQEILEKNPSFLCFTDHRRLNILSWKSKKVPNAQIVKIGDKRFIGFIRKDRNGESYWKYQPMTESSSLEETTQAGSLSSETIQQSPEKNPPINHERTENHQPS